MSSKQRLLELNARLAQNLTDKGVNATADETTTALINKVADIQSGGGGGDDTTDLIINLVERDISEFTIPYGTTRIGTHTFKGCTSLKKLIIPETVTQIGKASLSDTGSLRTELPDGVTEIGEEAFESNWTPTITKLPLELKIIGKNAFRYSVLSFTEIPSKVETIGAQAFLNCAGFTELTFRGTPTSIATNSFQGCSNLLNIYVPWAEGEVANAPWGVTNATIHYNSEV